LFLAYGNAFNDIRGGHSAAVARQFTEPLRQLAAKSCHLARNWRIARQPHMADQFGVM
jgi:hypothetical protein